MKSATRGLGDIALQANMLATKPDNLNSVFITSVVEGEKQLLKTVLPRIVTHVHTHTHTYTELLALTLVVSKNLKLRHCSYC